MNHQQDGRQEKLAFCAGAVSTLHVGVGGGRGAAFLLLVSVSWSVRLSLRKFFRHPVWKVVGRQVTHTPSPSPAHVVRGVRCLRGEPFIHIMSMYV